MSWTPRVVIPSCEGVYERILSSDADTTALQQYRDNNETILVTAVAWTSLLGDSPLGCKPNRVINSFVNSLLSDYIGTCNLYADLSDRVSRLIYHDHDSQVLITKDFIEDFRKTPIMKEYLEFFNERDPRILRYILSFLEFGRKVGYVADDLDAKAFHLWQQVEDRLKFNELPHFIDSLRAVIHWMFETGWVEGSFLPKHGSGAVAEMGVWGSEGKNRAITVDPKIAYMYERLESDELCLGTPTGFELPGKDVGLSTARLRFVPKDINKTRSICMEPIDFQWAQQAVRVWYERWLELGPLRHFVTLEDQTRNQIMCWHGSMTSDLATIDLSSASDSVSLQLVKAVFPAKVLKHLLATRSRLVDTGFDKEPIEVKKFAPMGSALCFPVQSTIFSAVVLMVSIAQSYGRDVWNGDTIADLSIRHAFAVTYGGDMAHRHYTRFAVYGDDIVCDKQVTSNTIRSLEELGFNVNTEKSYVDEVAYRESCGIHCFNGFDVTPFKLKTKPLSERMSLEALVSLIDATNRAAEYGYKVLYSHLTNVVLRHQVEQVTQHNGKNPVLFASLDSDESCAIRTREPRNDHLQRRGEAFAQRVVHTCSAGPGFAPKVAGTVFGPYQPVRLREPIGRVFGPYQPVRFTLNKESPVHRNKRVGATHLAYQREEVHSIAVRPKERRTASEDYDAYYLTLWWRARYDERQVPTSEVGLITADTKEVCVRRRWTAVE